jgi:hypothetical protein
MAGHSSTKARAAALAFAASGAVALLGTGCGSTPVDAVTVDPSSVSRDLVAHWAFDDGTGSIATDDAGGGHDGVLTGGTWIPSGQFGGALHFATGDHVTVSGFPQAATNWTVSVWFRSSVADLAANTTEWATIIGTETVFAGGWQVYLDNRPNFQRFDAGYWAGATVDDYVVVYCGCIEADRWIHLTAVWDGDQREARFYRDDHLVDSQPMPIPILPGDTTLYVGTWNRGERFLEGDVDDFAIWRRALQPAEITAISKQPIRR